LEEKMSEEFTTPIEDQKKDNSSLLIIILVVIFFFFCCCCLIFLAAGWLFGDFFVDWFRIAFLDGLRMLV
jgi:hypothetical protein